MRKYAGPIGMFCLFEGIAVTLWLAKDNLFYLFNFTYIGGSLALGMLLYIRRWKYARHVVQFLVGGYMLVYLGVICRENMQIEGLTVVRNYKSCGWGRERCDRKGHAVFLRPRVDSAIMGSASTGISTSSTKLKMISTFCLRLPPDLSGA